MSAALKYFSILLVLFLFGSLINSKISAYKGGTLQVLRLYPTIDTSVHSLPPYRNYNSNVIFFAGYQKGVGELKGLISFDLSKLPENAVIFYSQLYLYYDSFWGSGTENLRLNYYDATINSNITWSEISQLPLSRNIESNLLLSLDNNSKGKYVTWDTYNHIVDYFDKKSNTTKQITFVLSGYAGPTDKYQSFCGSNVVSSDSCFEKTPYLDISYYVPTDITKDKFDINGDGTRSILDIILLIRNIF